MSPLSRAVEEAGISGIRRKGNPTDIHAEDFFTESHRVRRLFAGLIHAADSSVAIVPSVSYGLATVARNLAFERGQQIVVLDEQFPSNVYIWRRLAQSRGGAVITVSAGATTGDRATAWNERVLETIDAKTAIVALPNVHWTDGTRFDLEAISDRTREVGAALVVDGTQSVGALSFDVRRVRPDALVCAGYKWLFGPYAVGVAYYDEKHHAGIPLEENWIARLHSEEFSRLVMYEDEYQPGAQRFDVGERGNFILLPMLAAALEQVMSWGADRIQEYCRQLTSGLIQDAAELGYRIEGTNGRAHHLFGIRMPADVEPDQLRAELERRGVSVSVRGSAVRVAPHVYNDEHDVAALLDALRAAVRVSA